MDCIYRRVKTLRIHYVVVGFTTYCHVVNSCLLSVIMNSSKFDIQFLHLQLLLVPILFCVLDRSTTLLHWNCQYNVPSIRMYSSPKELIT